MNARNGNFRIKYFVDSSIRVCYSQCMENIEDILEPEELAEYDAYRDLIGNTDRELYPMEREAA